MSKYDYDYDATYHLAKTCIATTWKLWSCKNDEHLQCVAICARRYDAEKLKEVWESIDDVVMVVITRHQTVSFCSV